MLDFRSRFFLAGSCAWLACASPQAGGGNRKPPAHLGDAGEKDVGQGEAHVVHVGNLTTAGSQAIPQNYNGIVDLTGEFAGLRVSLLGDNQRYRCCCMKFHNRMMCRLMHISEAAFASAWLHLRSNCGGVFGSAYHSHVSTVVTPGVLDFHKCMVPMEAMPTTVFRLGYSLCSGNGIPRASTAARTAEQALDASREAALNSQRPESPERKIANNSTPKGSPKGTPMAVHYSRRSRSPVPRSSMPGRGLWKGNAVSNGEQAPELAQYGVEAYGVDDVPLPSSDFYDAKHKCVCKHGFDPATDCKVALPHS